MDHKAYKTTIQIFEETILEISETYPENVNRMLWDAFRQKLTENKITPPEALEFLSNAVDEGKLSSFVEKNSEKDTFTLFKYYLGYGVTLSGEKSEKAAIEFGESNSNSERMIAITELNDHELLASIDAIKLSELKKVTKYRADSDVQELKALIYSVCKDSPVKDDALRIFRSSYDLKTKLRKFSKLIHKITLSDHFNEYGSFQTAGAGELDFCHINNDGYLTAGLATVDKDGIIEGHSLLRHPIGSLALSAVVSDDGKYICPIKTLALYEKVTGITNDRSIKRLWGNAVHDAFKFTKQLRHHKGGQHVLNDPARKLSYVYQSLDTANPNLKEAQQRLNETREEFNQAFNDCEPMSYGQPYNIWENNKEYYENALDGLQDLIDLRPNILRDSPKLSGTLAYLNKFFVKAENASIAHQVALKVIESKEKRSHITPKSIDTWDVSNETSIELSIKDVAKLSTHTKALFYGALSRPQGNQLLFDTDDIDTALSGRFAAQLYIHLDGMEDKFKGLENVSYPENFDETKFVEKLFTRKDTLAFELNDKKAAKEIDMVSAREGIENFDDMALRSLLNNLATDDTRSEEIEEGIIKGLGFKHFNIVIKAAFKKLAQSKNWDEIFSKEWNNESSPHEDLVFLKKNNLLSEYREQKYKDSVPNSPLIIDAMEAILEAATVNELITAKEKVLFKAMISSKKGEFQQLNVASEGFDSEFEKAVNDYQLISSNNDDFTEYEKEFKSLLEEGFDEHRSYLMKLIRTLSSNEEKQAALVSAFLKHPDKTIQAEAKAVIKRYNQVNNTTLGDDSVQKLKSSISGMFKKRSSNSM